MLSLNDEALSPLHRSIYCHVHHAAYYEIVYLVCCYFIMPRISIPIIYSVNANTHLVATYGNHFRCVYHVIGHLSLRFNVKGIYTEGLLQYLTSLNPVTQIIP